MAGIGVGSGGGHRGHVPPADGEGGTCHVFVSIHTNSCKYTPVSQHKELGKLAAQRKPFGGRGSAIPNPAGELTALPIPPSGEAAGCPLPKTHSSNFYTYEKLFASPNDMPAEAIWRHIIMQENPSAAAPPQKPHPASALASPVPHRCKISCDAADGRTCQCWRSSVLQHSVPAAADS